MHEKCEYKTLRAKTGSSSRFQKTFFWHWKLALGYVSLCFFKSDKNCFLLPYNQLYVSCDPLTSINVRLDSKKHFKYVQHAWKMGRNNSTSQNGGLVNVCQKLFLTLEISSWPCQRMRSFNPTKIAFAYRRITSTGPLTLLKVCKVFFRVQRVDWDAFRSFLKAFRWLFQHI